MTASHTVLAVQILRALRVLGESLARIWTAALRCARTRRAIPPIDPENVMKSTVGRPRQVTDAQVDAIMSWYRARKTRAQLAAELGLHPKVVNQVIERRGIYKQPSPELRHVAKDVRHRRLNELRSDGWL